MGAQVFSGPATVEVESAQFAATGMEVFVGTSILVAQFTTVAADGDVEILDFNGIAAILAQAVLLMAVGVIHGGKVMTAGFIGADTGLSGMSGHTWTE